MVGRQQLARSSERNVRESQQALPELHQIVHGIQTGASSPAEFRFAMDSFSKKSGEWGFRGPSGQMFLNMLVKASDEHALGEALRAALPAPADEDECRKRFADFLAIVQEARERAQTIGVPPPSLGYTPFFLSFFWEAGKARRVAHLLPELARHARQARALPRQRAARGALSRLPAANPRAP